MAKLLLVEDDTNLRHSLAEFLGAEGFEVWQAESVGNAREKLQEKPDVVILDWMLGNASGVDLLAEWRRQGVTCPVVMLTAKTELVDKVLGLELGADDYLTKPFAPRELLARLRVQLRRAAPAVAESFLQHSGIRLDVLNKEVRYQGRQIELTKLEYLLLKTFLENPGRIFSREELLNQVWGYDRYPTTRTIDTHVLQLRQKFEPELFETVRGMGYRFAKTWHSPDIADRLIRESARRT